MGFWKLLFIDFEPGRATFIGAIMLSFLRKYKNFINFKEMIIKRIVPLNTKFPNSRIVFWAIISCHVCINGISFNEKKNNYFIKKEIVELVIISDNQEFLCFVSLIPSKITGKSSQFVILLESKHIKIILKFIFYLCSGSFFAFKVC